MVDSLILSLKTAFGTVKEHRYKNAQTPLADYLQSGFAMFHLKDPSLHHYRINFKEREANLSRIYGIDTLHSDSAMREAIDGIDPKDLQKCFKVPLQMLNEMGITKEYKVLGKYNCLLIDGTEHYCTCTSDAPCEQCLTKVHRNKKGEVTKTTYHHQALGCVMAHPEHKEVFPIVSEAIVKQDGETKNDCELNAAKRLMPLIREALPQSDYELLVVLDALYPNGPFIRTLNKHNLRYVIGIKEGFVCVQVEDLRKKNALHEYEWENASGEKCVARYYEGLILNGENQDILVNYFEYEQFDKKGVRTYSNSWVTDLPVNKDNVQELVKVGRSRWKIENETFNTLKNQGYHLEHSYGHGTKNLATNFMLLTFLAFLVDQIAQKLDDSFKKALAYCKTKKNLWEKVRHVFDLLPCMSMDVIYRFISKELKIDFPMLV
jgi:Transposase DDE domain